MARKSPVEDDYTQCLAELVPASGDGIYTLTIIYKLSQGAESFRRIKSEIIAAKANASTAGIAAHWSELPAEDGCSKRKITFTKHSGGKQQPFLTSEIKAFTYNLESQGVLNKDGAAAFVRAFCEGNGPASMVPPPIPAPSPQPSAPPPATTIAAPTTASPAIVPQSYAQPPAVPLQKYQSINTKIGVNSLSQKQTLKITYNMYVHPNQINQDYAALCAAIRQAQQSLPRQGAVYTDIAIGKIPTNPSIGSNGMASASFDVEFSMKMGMLTQNIQEQDMRDIAYALAGKGCLSRTEFPILQTEIGQAVRQRNWSPNP